MKNKMITGVIIAVVLLSAAVLLWYFSPSDVSIVSLEAPKELRMGQLSELKINLQNNAPKDVNVIMNVKNAFVDEKGVSLKGITILAHENLSYIPSDTTEPQKEVQLKPGSNSITVSIGYQVPGTQKVEIEVYQQGKFADSRTVEVNVPPPKIELRLWNYTGINGTNEIHTVYGNLEGKGFATGVAVNISVINELTNTSIKTVTRMYSFNIKEVYEFIPLVVWENRNSTYDPVTGARTTVFTETFAPIVVIEIAKDEPSAEKYLMSPIVVKGKIGDRYRVVVTARWMDQVVSSEMRIPP